MSFKLTSLLVGKNQKFESRVEYQRTLLTSQLLLLAMAVVTSYSILDIFAGLHQTFRFSIPFLCVLAFCFWLNFTGKRSAAKIILLLSTNLILFAYASTASFATGTSFYFIVTSIAALVLFGYEERGLAVLFPILSLALFLISYFTNFRPFAYAQLSDAIIFRSFVINFFSTLIASTFEVLFLMRLNFYSEKEIKDRELKIVEQNNELIKANGDLDRFVYSASHDLRAPLSSVMGLVHLSKVTPNESELRQYVEMIGIRVKDLDRVIKDILNYSRNARTEIKSVAVDIDELIQSTWDELRFDLNANNIKMIKSSLEKIVVKTDRDRLKVVLANFFSNAIKYSNPKQENPHMVVSAKLNGDILSIEVSDNGIGIHAEHLPKIFDMFYRATDRGAGSGLGLFIVKETLEKLKGEVEFTSELGKGTSFKIKIPVEQV